MPRKLRIEYEGAIYHVMNRGDRGEPIFRDDHDREAFLETLGQACGKTGWHTLAWCLMNNHFHLVIETPQANLVAGMKWFLGTYTGRFNRRHKVFGHLFAGRYKALVVDGSGNGYLRTVCDYVHLNPARAQLLEEKAKLSSYRWSSYGEYLKPPGQRVPWVRVERLFGEMGIPKDSIASRRKFEQVLELRRWEDEPEAWKELRRGWCVGDEEFRKELLETVSGPRGDSHYGAELRESALEKADRIIKEELVRLGWKDKDLTTTLKSDPAKVRIAQRLRAETTTSLKWIADRLNMGTWTHVANLLGKARQ